MVTSSIMKDMQPNSEVIYRPNAIRALCRIIDVSSFNRVSIQTSVYDAHEINDGFWFVAIYGAGCRTVLQSCDCG